MEEEEEEEEEGEEERKRRYLHFGHFGVGGDVAVILLGELRFGLAKVFTGSLEGGIRHDCSNETLVDMVR